MSTSDKVLPVLIKLITPKEYSPYWEVKTIPATVDRTEYTKIINQLYLAMVILGCVN